MILPGPGGSEAEMWNWRPNWSRGVIERLQWFTNVLQAGRGEEQRRALRLDPRQLVEFTVTTSGQQRRIMENQFTARGSAGISSWVIPLWFDGHSLTSTLSSGASSIPLSPAQRGYEIGDYVLLTNGDPDHFELGYVSALGASIGLYAPTTETWPAGTMVYPARLARLETASPLERFTGRDATIRTIWRMENPKTWAAAESLPSYSGATVFEQRPNWVQDPTLALDTKLAVLDSGTGRVSSFDEAGIPLPLQRMGFTLTNRAEIDAWKRRLWALRGKQAPIWMPTWADDVTVVAPVAADDTSIDVERFGYTAFSAPADSVNREVLRVELLNGTVLYLRIDSADEPVDDMERLHFADPIGTAFEPADVALVSFMMLARSDSDQHELEYFTGAAARTVFAAKGFRHVL